MKNPPGEPKPALWPRKLSGRADARSDEIKTRNHEKSPVPQWPQRGIEGTASYMLTDFRSAIRYKSLSHPSFSSLMCWIATAFAFASRSGIERYPDTQQRLSL